MARLAYYLRPAVYFPTSLGVFALRPDAFGCILRLVKHIADAGARDTDES